MSLPGRTVWIWDPITKEHIEESVYRKMYDGKYVKKDKWGKLSFFQPRTYYNMADHPVTVNSPGELKAALKKYDCFEKG